MSIIRLLINDDGEDVFEPLRDNPCHNVLQKFRAYRLKAEKNEADTKEQKEVIDRLRDEIKMSREVEKTNASMLLSSQARLDSLEEKQRLFNKLSAQQRESEKSIRKMDETLEDITHVIHEVQEKCRSLVSSGFQYMDLMKRNEALREELNNKERELGQIKSELESVMKDKVALALQYESRHEDILNQLKTTRNEANEIRDHSNMAINFYRQQLTEYEKKIAEMEAERKRMLLDFNVRTAAGTAERASTSEKKLPRPDSTVSCIVDERSGLDKNNFKMMEKDEGSDSSIGEKAASARPVASNRRKFPQPGLKQKLSTSASQDNVDFQAASSQLKSTRRLYSQSSDNYLK